jgi:hypothetical protein
LAIFMLGSSELPGCEVPSAVEFVLVVCMVLFESSGLVVLDEDCEVDD